MLVSFGQADRLVLVLGGDTTHFTDETGTDLCDNQATHAMANEDNGLLRFGNLADASAVCKNSPW
jgi:hypothetical protein